MNAALSVASLLPRAAARFGHKIALTLTDGRSFSYDALEALASKFAGGLIASGVVPQDRVLLYLPNSWEWIVAYHAIARLGAVVVPANGLLKPIEAAFIAADAGAKIAIVPGDRISALASTQALAAEPLVFVVVGESDQESIAFEALCEGPPAAAIDVGADELMTIGYTSGTTGRPKGAMLTHRGVFTSAAMTATLHVRNPHDVVVSALPFSHVYGNIVMNAGLMSGARLVALTRFEAKEALQLIEQQKATLFEGVPTMYYQMLASSHLSHADLSSLTRCTVGGQTMPRAKLRAVVDRFGCPLLELWGMTEVGGPAVTHSPYWPERHGSIGLPFPGMDVRIADLSDPKAEAPVEEAGELLIRGPLVMRGYWKNPAASAEAIDAGGWLSTGDIALRDDDGYVFVVDRRKDMIITAGYNIYPAELEQVLAMHPGVAMVAVGSIPDAEKGEIAKAYVVRHTSSDVSAADLTEYCREYLGVYKIPRQITFVDDLPKTSTGKVLRRELQAAFESSLLQTSAGSVT